MGESDREAPPPVNPNLLRLPKGIEETGDPVDGNPFPPTDGRHELWERVTISAVENISRLKSEWLRWQEALTDPTSLDEMVAWNAKFRAEKRRVTSEEFQIWAGRGVQVVGSPGDVQRFDEWLVNYAAAILEIQAGHMGQYGLAPHLIDAEIRALRDHLTALVLHWKAEGRRIYALRQAEFENHRNATADSVKEQRRRPQSASPAAMLNRAEWLQQALDQRKWTRRDLQRHGGPDAKTLKRILSGKPVKETVLEKLAQSLSLARQRVRLSDIPND